MRPLLAAALLPALACRQHPPSTDTGGVRDTGPDWVDRDGDLYPEGVDCDDTDPAVNPGAQERCNGRDDDCDRRIDEDPEDGQTWYADADGDGHGGSAYSEVACAAPEGTTASADDCDDTDAASYPGAAERCDEADNDCDGEIDEDAVDPGTWYLDADGDGSGDPGAPILACAAPSGAVSNDDDCDDGDPALHASTTWYFDADGDGAGDPARSFTGCAAPAGHVSAGDDCDDADPAVHPGAEERCDGLDNDCDGSADGGDAVDAATWYDDADGDGYGDASRATLACTQPSGTTADSQDCDDGDAATWPGAAELCDDGVDQDCNGRADNTCLEAASADAAWASWLGGDDYDYLGITARGDADLSGDGQADLLLGAPGAEGGGTNLGALLLLTGPLSAGADRSADAEGAAVVGGVDGEHLGRAVGLGDWSGDGVLDLAVGSLYGEAGGGTVSLIAGPLGPGSAAALAWARFDGAAAYDYLGADSIADAGDLDGDGAADLVVAAIGADGNGSGGGAVYLFLGPLSASRDAGAADARIDGDDGGDNLGRGLVGSVDLDGDGLADVAAGAPGSSTGSVFVFLGGAVGTLDAADADAMVLGTDSDTGLGYALRAVGDADGDGSEDLLAGAPYVSDGADYSLGAVYLLTGPWSGSRTTADAAWSMVGDDDYAFLGQGVGGAGDLDLDGHPDLVFGAPSDGSAATGAGAAYVVWGPMAGAWTVAHADVEVLGAAAADYAGWRTEIAADLDGDGGPELLVGSQRRDGYTGKAWLLAGSGL